MGTKDDVPAAGAKKPEPPVPACAMRGMRVTLAARGSNAGCMNASAGTASAISIADFAIDFSKGGIENASILKRKKGIPAKKRLRYKRK